MPRSNFEEYQTPDSHISISFALFNGHLNSATERAKKSLGILSQDYLDRVNQIEKEGDGIMEIFNRKPEEATVAFLALVHAFVNNH